MRLILLFIAPVLYAQSILVVRAGVLTCGAVRRAIDQIQTYCYEPGPAPQKLVHNTIDTLYPATVQTYAWCSAPGNPTGCTPSAITWSFVLKPEGIYYELTTDASTIQKGTLTQIYGQPPPQALLIPHRTIVTPWAGTVTDTATGDRWPAVIAAPTRNCRTCKINEQQCIVWNGKRSCDLSILTNHPTIISTIPPCDGCPNLPPATCLPQDILFPTHPQYCASPQ